MCSALYCRCVGRRSSKKCGYHLVVEIESPARGGGNGMKERLNWLIEGLLEAKLFLPEAIELVERSIIECSLRRNAWNERAAAKELGIHPSTLHRKIGAYGIVAAGRRRKARPPNTNEPRSPLVFLCHSHKDKEFVRQIAHDLLRLSVRVWFDEWELTSGDSLHGCIGKAIRSAAFVAVVLSPDSLKSRWCQSELQEALAIETRRGRKIVLPLLCKRVQPPVFLEDRLYTNFNVRYFESLAQLVGLVNKIDRRSLQLEISRSRPSSIQGVRRVLRNCGWESIKYIPQNEYERMLKTLRAAGIPISGNRFYIIPQRSARMYCGAA